MPYSARIILDSVAEVDHNFTPRLTTMELTYPRFVHAEFMTHRMFSRNAASSRAIPISKMIERVAADPVSPIWWGANEKGMQANAELDTIHRQLAKEAWEAAWAQAINSAVALQDLGAHKQIVNRVLEPFSWITVLVTATDWANFFHLRCHRDAQPEIRRIAEMAADLYYTEGWDTTSAGIPQEYRIKPGGWHRPFIVPSDEVDARTMLEAQADLLPDEWMNVGGAYDYQIGHDRTPWFISNILNRVSVARCARVSYLTHDGKRSLVDDLALYRRLATSGHWSPFEHVAQAPTHTKEGGGWRYEGNFRGWQQLRKRMGQWSGYVHSESGENITRFNWEARKQELYPAASAYTVTPPHITPGPTPRKWQPPTQLPGT